MINNLSSLFSNKKSIFNQNQSKIRIDFIIDNQTNKLNFKRYRKTFFIKYDINKKNKIKIIFLKIKLYDIKLGILKIYIIYSYKFYVFEIARLLNAYEKKGLLLIKIRLRKFLIYLNIIYLIFRYICQQSKQKYY